MVRCPFEGPPSWFPCRAVLSDGARHSFEKKGFVLVSKEDRSGSPVSLDRALELAIEAGAEDVQEEEEDDEKVTLKVRYRLGV